MISGQSEGQLLQVSFARCGKAKTALDIGTLPALHSALALPEALPQDGRLVTLEREQTAASIAVSNWAGSPHSGKTTSQVGDASNLLAALAAKKEAFDLVFLDVDKPGYLAIYQQLMDMKSLKVNSLLVVDNTMYKGKELLGPAAMSVHSLILLS